MTIGRRQFLGLAGASAAAPLLQGCSGDKPEVSLDRRFPIGPFGADSTAEEVTAGLDLSGSTALVTGCNSGLGYETMRVLALRGAHVTMACRNLDKADRAINAISAMFTLKTGDV